MPDARHDPAPFTYEIEVGVRLRGRLRDGFAGFEVRDGDRGSRLVGVLADQAAVYGVLGRLRDLGIPLVGVMRVPADQGDGTTASRSDDADAG